MARNPGVMEPSPQVAIVSRRNVLIAAPFVLAVPLAFALGFRLLGLPLNWLAVGAGAVGWVVALALRNPVALVAYWRLRTPERVQPWIVAASGPCEEVTRLVVVMLVGRVFPTALSIGLGWTTIECVYVIVNGLAITSLAHRTDEKARQAMQLIAAQGLGNLLKPSAPFWGIMERVSASGVQIGFTLLLAWQPGLVLASIPAHTGTNFLWLWLARRSMVVTEVSLAVIGALALAGGFSVYGRM